MPEFASVRHTYLYARARITIRCRRNIETNLNPVRVLVYPWKIIGGGLQAKIPWVHGLMFVVRPSTTLHVLLYTSPCIQKCQDKHSHRKKGRRRTAINASSERAKIADTKVEPWADGHSGANEERDLEEWQGERGLHGSTALNLDWALGGLLYKGQSEDQVISSTRLICISSEQYQNIHVAKHQRTRDSPRPARALYMMLMLSAQASGPATWFTE